MTKQIGILGGTFDPIHYGHLRPALDVLQALDLEQVRFLPNKTPPHRQLPWLDAAMRRELVELAIADVPEFVFDDRELQREGPSYMVDTLADLHREYPDHGLCLIMGMDAFSGFTQWHRWQAILDLCHLVITTRPGVQVPDFAEYQAEIEPRICKVPESLAQSPCGKILIQSVTLLDISATQIRESLNSGKSIRYLVPDNVREKLENICNSMS